MSGGVEGLRQVAERGRTQPLVMLTAYDLVSARVAEAAGVDLVLTGDSGAMVVLGYSSTREVSLEEMLMLTRATARGLGHTPLIGDLPFGTYESSDEQAVTTARMFAAAGCDAVKLEGAGPIVDRARAIVNAGIPVMGHIGLAPQQSGGPEGFRVQGRTADEAVALIDDARALEAAGCWSLVLEAIPAPVAARVARAVRIPTIGIGAGAGVTGQVLVFHDLLGMYAGRQPKFVKRYAEIESAMRDAVARWSEDVRAHRYPASEHNYGAPADQLAELERRLESGNR